MGNIQWISDKWTRSQIQSYDVPYIGNMLIGMQQVTHNLQQ